MPRPSGSFASAPYPRFRARRARAHAWSRAMARETRLSPADLIWPVFVIEGQNRSEPVATMPGIERLSIDRLQRAAEQAFSLGIPAIALFPVIAKEQRRDDGALAANPDNLVCRAVRAVKSSVPELGVVCDVALDPFTCHGHDGIVIDGKIANDPTVALLIRQALVQVEAGCDIIAPSDMMDGRIGAIRDALETANRQDVILLSYSAKYASAFYGPFRDALGVNGAYGPAGKTTYQMDQANGDEAIREVASDLAEGADWIMVKPGLPYLDIVHRVKETFAVPTFVYQVSGEYAMIQVAAAVGCLNGEQAMLESLTACKRAGASGIFTYAALQIAQLLQKE